MADEGNAAVLEAPTAPASEAPPSETPETAQLAAPENAGGQVAPDSADDDETPTFTKKQLAEQVAQAEKAAAAKAEESARRKAEAKDAELREAARAEAYKQQLTRAQLDTASGIKRDLTAGFRDVARKVEAGELSPGEVLVNDQWLNNIAIRAERAAFLTIHKQWDEETDLYLSEDFPDFKVPRELSKKREQAVAAQDHKLMARTLFETAQAAITESLSPRLRAQVEAELRESDEAAGKTARIAEADEKRGQQGRPANVTGGAAGAARTFKTQNAVDLALFNGEIDTNAARFWLAKGLPKS